MTKYFKTMDRKVFFFLIPFTVFLLLFVSNDSYLYDMYGKNDSTIFFMSGKAWMNGMIPYVDFSDSKGPLLWLIYGVGYLISHYNYIGVFWVTCVFYIFIFYYIYKTANLFLEDRRLSVLASVLMSLSFFDPLVHNDIRAEDFSQLFIVLSLYWSCKVLYVIPQNRQTIRICAYVIGFCIAACIMIKFTIAAMILIMWGYVLFTSVKGVKELEFYILYSLLGSATIMLPFLIVFAFEGNLAAFFYEYFIRTFITVNHTNDSLGYFDKMFSYFSGLAPFVIFSISLAATLIFANGVPKHKYFPLICFLWFYFVTIQNGIWNHYYVTCTSFALFGVIFILQFLKKKNYSYNFNLIVFILFLVCSSVNVVRNALYTKSFLLCKTEQRNIYYEYASIMSQVPSPKIVVIGMELGYGAPVGTLPGCKFWARQTGAIQEMIDNQMNAIKNRNVDFVLVQQMNPDVYNLLRNVGYFPNYIKNSEMVIFSKNKVSNIRTINVSFWDILLKRNLYDL